MSRLRLSGSIALLSFGCVLAAVSPTLAAPRSDATLPEVVVTADDRPKAATKTAEPGLATPLGAFTLDGAPLAAAAAATSDTAAMMTAIPGVAVAAGGGVSSLPVVRGFADDQINVLTMGMAITSACANHMNPPLSYVDPSRVGKVEVLAGVVPVSKGGDSIGGTIIVAPADPRFARGDGIEVQGSIAGYGRSNGNGLGGSVTASVANRDWSLDYTGAWSKSGNDTAGGGGTVRSTEYESQNHTLRLAHRTDAGLFTISGGHQDIPKQGYPNAWMDMLYNHAGFVNATYEGAFDWGRLDGKVFWHHTEHYMNFLDDKGGSTPSTGMPMYTRGDDLGYSVKGSIDWTKQDIVRIGNEFHHTGLDDWWPAVAGSMMMSPKTYRNIDGGRRDRFGTFAEWERSWTSQWSTLLGGRIDFVDMDTGNVQDYACGMMCMSDTMAATAFNARDHHKTDVNFDLTALARWKPAETFDAEFGYSRKTHSPNLYERYAWGTGGMSSQMIGWYGDGNGYIGNLDLKPEVAHTISTTLWFHDVATKRWSLKVTPYLSWVQNYIDADRVTPPMGWDPNFLQLKFANHDAFISGFDASAEATIASSPTWGDVSVSGSLGYTRGENLDTHDGLYRIMPFNGTVALNHRLGDWSNTLEVKAVSSKTDVSTNRLEQQTAGYGLLNYRTAYRWRNIDVGIGADNIFDQKYSLPLGGVNVTDYGWYGTDLHPVYGQGRTVWASVKVSF